jgi:hypothetical protein
LDSNELTHDSILSEYKESSTVLPERVCFSQRPIIFCRQYFPKKSRENRVPGNDYGFMSAGLYLSATTN